ncbi:MAG: pilus assembly protein TadG-related protein [Pirellulales bacterium]
MLRQSPRRRLARHRRGGILILALVCLTAMFAFAALAIDVGYLMNARTESRRAADAAALGACWEYSKAVAAGKSVIDATTIATTKAKAYASGNPVASVAPSLATSGSNADIKVGYLSDLTNRSAPLDFSNPARNNAIEIRVRRTEQMNGAVPVFFARVFGLDSRDVVASATAAMLRNVNGVKTPSDGSNLDLLPFALDLQTWNLLMANSSTLTDTWKYNESTKTVSAGGDGIKEVNLYPQGTGSPGNRGTVDIGSSNNSTADIARQILNGVSAADMAYVGGKLEFNSQGYFELNGDTGISAGIKDELASIIGKPRVIPVFSQVTGPGNNAVFRIVKLVGIRITEVKLTGSNNTKRVMIQPAPVVLKGAIQGTSTSSSDYVYSRVVLVR